MKAIIFIRLIYLISRLMVVRRWNAGGDQSGVTNSLGGFGVDTGKVIKASPCATTEGVIPLILSNCIHRQVQALSGCWMVWEYENKKALELKDILTT